MPFAEDFAACLSKQKVTVDPASLPDRDTVERAFKNIQTWFGDLDVAVRDGFDEGTAEYAVCFALAELDVAPEIPGILQAFDETAGQRLSELVQGGQGCLGRPVQAKPYVSVAPVAIKTKHRLQSDPRVPAFAKCYANHVGTTVDAVIDDLNQIGADGIQRLVTWFRGLGDRDSALILFLSNVATAVLLKILTKAVSQVVAAALIGLLGGAAWALLVRAFIVCVDTL